MICPLFYHANLMLAESGPEVYTDCLELECAWWDEKKQYCSILTIAIALESISKGINVSVAK